MIIIIISAVSQHVKSETHINGYTLDIRYCDCKMWQKLSNLETFNSWLSIINPLSSPLSSYETGHYASPYCVDFTDSTVLKWINFTWTWVTSFYFGRLMEGSYQAHCLTLVFTCSTTVKSWSKTGMGHSFIYLRYSIYVFRKQLSTILCPFCH